MLQHKNYVHTTTVFDRFGATLNMTSVTTEARTSVNKRMCEHTSLSTSYFSSLIPYYSFQRHYSLEQYYSFEPYFSFAKSLRVRRI